VRYWSCEDDAYLVLETGADKKEGPESRTCLTTAFQSVFFNLSWRDVDAFNSSTFTALKFCKGVKCSSRRAVKGRKRAAGINLAADSQLMQPKTPAWIKSLSITVAPLGTKRVKKPSGKVYEYVYVRLSTGVWPEVFDAYKVRLKLAPPDLSAPPVAVVARRFQGGARSVAFDIPREYQKLIKEYIRNGVVAVLDVEVVERLTNASTRATTNM